MPSTYDVARCWAGFALLGAGLIHLAVVREHLAESALHGAFFVVVGAGQLGVALVAVARGRMPAPGIVVAAQLGVVALWAASRTTGLPVGPQPWAPEPVGTADVLAVSLELLAVAAVLVLTLPARRRLGTAVRPARWLAMVGAGALVVASLTTPALASTEAGEHAKEHGSSHHH
ncbi:MAG: hypothetical protein ACRDWY_07455 [Actinomycetes bacterium]